MAVQVRDTAAAQTKFRCRCADANNNNNNLDIGALCSTKSGVPEPSASNPLICTALSSKLSDADCAAVQAGSKVQCAEDVPKQNTSSQKGE
ncbi:hypothetical protein CSOJ01_10358 [Colletotrichum sojae]|uniref:Uncharacterized protein n=1 Tax=Colletotrichum sojae TaxID=2175907 RepID=A0A8H6J0N1_9PEZI|nr:hypothetical protein CSOJ01_10358 [Colletotrichum sojae]